MSAAVSEFNENDVNIDELDFSDLEAKFEVEEPTQYLDNYVLCDGAPIAPESKAPMLKKVLAKLFNQCGKVVDICLPLEDGKTKGYLIVKFAEPSMASKAVKQLNGKKLDVKHRLLVNKLSDIEKYVLSGKVTDKFKEPKIAPYESHGYLNSWLQDESGRDQYLLHFANVVGVYWHKKNIQPEPAIEPRSQWTSSFMKFSPKGKFLFSMFPQGVQSWGGANFDRINRFYHNGVRLIDFSPNEKFLVTLSPEPIILPSDDSPLKEDFPFGPESEGHKLVVWDIQSGLAVRTFALPPNLEKQPNMPWPLIKWSFDDKYCARMGPDALAVYDTTQDFQLLDKKLLKIDGIMDFKFAPAGVRLSSSRRNDPLDVVLAYWTPESNNQSAKVSVMHLPNKTVLRTVPLVQVNDCELYWQDDAKYLCCKINRHTKSKKTIFSHLEIFQLTEKDIPVEKIEFQEVVLNFAWEPRGSKFAIISKLDKGESNIAIPSNDITFYDVEDTKTNAALTPKIKKWVALITVPKKFSNEIRWSPKGRFVAISTFGKTKAPIEFYDLEYEGEKPDDQSKKVSSNLKLLNTQEFGGLTGLSWDPSGRSLAAWSSTWDTKIENGYKIYDFVGRLLREELIDAFAEFQWRPRPISKLSSNDKKKVRKNLKEYSAQFEEIDNMEADEELRELILKRKKLLSDWTEWRKIITNKLGSLGLLVKEDDGKLEVIEELKEAILEEKEEVIEK